MVYILAGVDCTGKTTVYNKLKKVLGNAAVFVKESNCPTDKEKRYRLQKLQALIESGETVIYDRATAIDDYVYEPVMAGKDTALDMLTVQDLLTHCVVIYFHAANETITSRLQYRGDEHVTPDMVPEIVRRYDKFFNELLLPNVYPVNVDGKSEMEVFNQVFNIVSRKSFKVAHIVPVSSLNLLDNKQYLMCLAHLVTQNEQYATYYRNAALDPSRFVLLDNGAAEDSQLSNAELLQCVQTISPNEMVLPDTLCDKDDTLKKLHEALAFFVEKHNVPCKFMAVPQGKNLAEWTECAKQMLQVSEVNSIGVSKFLPMQTGAELIRNSACFALQELIEKYERYDVEVHLLGCSERPCVIDSIRKRYPFVRGCDSAYGYLAAQADSRVYGATKRPEGTIDFLNGQTYNGLQQALEDFEIACGAFNNSPEQNGEW